MTKYERYISNIKGGKVNHGEWLIKLVDWHLSEIDKSEKYIFDKEQANKYINFIEKLEFTQGKWAGNKFNLEDWQAFFISMVFGWVHQNSGLRRFKQVTLNVPKKNGKTELGAAIAIATSFLDADERGQIFMAATTQDQAKICFDAAKAIVTRIKPLSARYIMREHRLIVNRNQTYIRYISSEADATEGKGASVVIFDEEHLQKDNELRDNLKSGMGAREQPLFISISTAGTDKSLPYFKHLETCKKILNGILEDETHLILIYSAPDVERVDWENKEVWQIANPNWGVSVIEENFLADYIEAKNDPSKQPNFITKKLNIWADSERTWIDHKHWISLSHNYKLEDFDGEECYLGLDLGQTGDFAALSIMFIKDNQYFTFTRFWIPEEMAGKRTKADGLKFKDWARQGFIKLTDGNSTDFTLIEDDIVNLSSRFTIISLAYDKAFASMLITRLINEWGVECKPFGQGVANVTGPTKQLHEWILTKQFFHDNNPVMNWMVSNVYMYTDDANGNMKPHKGKSKNKIDGVTALINAVGDYLIDYSNNYGNDNIIFV
jgi:phage terminase large subunit-like protein